MEGADWSNQIKLAAWPAIKTGTQPCPSHSFRGRRGKRLASYKQMARRSESRLARRLWTEFMEADDQDESEAGDRKESGRT